MAQCARQGLADPVQAFPAGVHEPHPVAQPGREGLPDHGVLPDVVIVEQVPVGRLLRAVGAQEAPAQPRHRRQLAAEQERRLRPAQRLGGRAIARDRPELAGPAIGPLQQQRRLGVADVRTQAGGRGDTAAGVGVGQAGLVSQRLPTPVRPPVRVQLPGRPVRVPRRLPAAAAGVGVLEHGPLPAAGADPPDSRAQPAVVRQFFGGGARRIDSEAPQQLAGRRDHRVHCLTGPAATGTTREDRRSRALPCGR